MSHTIPSTSLGQSASASLDELAEKAGHAVDKAQHVAEQTVSKVKSEAKDLAGLTPSLIDLAAEKIKDLAARSATYAKDGSDVVKKKAKDAADATSDRIRQDPLKSVLIAVAAGAAVAALAGYVASKRSSR